MTDLPKAAEAAGNYQEIPSSVLSRYEQPDHQSREVEKNSISNSPSAAAPIHRRLPANAIAHWDQEKAGMRTNHGFADENVLVTGRIGLLRPDLGSGFGLGRHETGFPIRGRTVHSASQIRLRRERCSVRKEKIYKLFTLDRESPMPTRANNDTLPSNF